jgi:hypothetical protein
MLEWYYCEPHHQVSLTNVFPGLSRFLHRFSDLVLTAMVTLVLFLVSFQSSSSRCATSKLEMLSGIRGIASGVRLDST